MIRSDFIAGALLRRYKLRFAGIVAVFIAGLLCWEHFHGGVPNHHILQRKDLPGISNWWGGLLLPVLTWLLLTRIERRFHKMDSGKVGNKSVIIPALRLLLTGAGFGLLLATCFTFGYQPFLDNVLYILLILGLVVPLYYSEFILGFVLGMVYTFGAILPTAFVVIIAAIGFLLFKFIRPLFIKLFTVFKK